MAEDSWSGEREMTTSRENFLTRLLLTALAVHLALLVCSGIFTLLFTAGSSKLNGLFIAIVLATAMANHGLHGALASIWRQAVQREQFDSIGFVIGSAVIAVMAACGLVFFV